MRTLVFIAVVLLATCGFTQTNISIDEFTNANNYYVAFGSGSGTLNKSINTTDFYSGSECLKIDYNIPQNVNSYFSILRNYSSQTQDWSFQNQIINFALKGGNINATVSLKIWEDINMNGAIDGEDEVYESGSILVGSSNWNKIGFSLSTFNKIAGSGNSTLDLNRVRAYEIVVYDNSDWATNGTILFDDFSITTNYLISDNSTQLNGSFIQLWNSTGCSCGQWTQAQWDTELQRMKDLCLNKLIVQYSIYHDLSWYTPSSVSGVIYQMNTLNYIVNAAEKAGVEIVFGLYFDEEWNNSNKALTSSYSTLLTKHKATVDEIYNLFGSSSSFGGWYIPQELNDLEWQNDPEKSLLFEWIKDIADYTHTKSNDPIIIAPFFNLWQPADVVGDWYDELLTTATNLDGVYPQDGVGITLKDPAYHVPLYFEEIKAACDAHGVTFGGTVESFQQTSGWPIDNGSFTATSADIDRLKNQMWAASDAGASELIQFSWSYMQPGVSTASDQLYSDYSTYKDCSITTVSNHNEEDEFHFYPNPVSEQLYFSGKEMKLYNLNGELIKAATTSPVQVSDLPSGLYILSLEEKRELLRIE